jgi:hypothetical protein
MSGSGSKASSSLKAMQVRGAKHRDIIESSAGYEDEDFDSISASKSLGKVIDKTIGAGPLNVGKPKAN